MNEKLKKKIEQGIIAQEGGSYCVWGDDYSYLTLIDKDGYKIDDYLIDIVKEEGVCVVHASFLPISDTCGNGTLI